jgi:cytochrome P450
MTIAFEPLSGSWRDDPYSVYAQLRESDPVHWAPEANAFCISRYDDVVQVMRNAELFSSEAMGSELMAADFGGTRLRHLPRVLRFMWRARINPLGSAKPEALISVDAPRHDELRSIVNRGFTPRRVDAWEARIAEIVGSCMAKLDTSGSFDVVRDLAVPLPTQIIAEMLGIGVDRLTDFKRWTDAIISIASGSAKENPAETGALDDLGELFVALRELIRDRKAAPQDDLISTIVDPAHGKSLHEMEVMNFVVLLLAAGNETTTNLIGNATNALLAHPDQLTRLEADPTLIPNMLEEVLRYDAPVQLLYRNATQDTELSGRKIPAGSIVVPILASGNRDEARFPEADRFDVTRDARGHLSFGLGVHFCLGASLARLEARLAMQALVPHLSGLQRESQHDEWVDSSLVRGRRSLALVSQSHAPPA